MMTRTYTVENNF